MRGSWALFLALWACDAPGPSLTVGDYTCERTSAGDASVLVCREGGRCWAIVETDRGAVEVDTWTCSEPAETDE